MIKREIIIPIKIASESNMSEHWAQKRKRRKAYINAIKYYWFKHEEKITLPCTIYLIRQGPRRLDFDNLVSAFKCIRDLLADLIIPGMAYGQADNDPRLKWEYDQSKGNYAVIIKIFYEGE